MRAQRNRKVQDKLNVFGIKKSVIDSSQVVGAMQLIKFYKRWKKRKAKRLAAAEKRNSKAKNTKGDAEKFFDPDQGDNGGSS